MSAEGDEAALRAEIVRLNKVVRSLMDRAEREMSNQRSTFGLFQGTIVLEGQVRNRTRDLEAALRENEKMTRALQNAKERLEREKESQRQLLRKLEEAHVQLLQSEKLASIGQLAAGVAHEINNPIAFINSNLGTLGDYVAALLKLIETYESGEPLLHDDPVLSARLDDVKKEADIAFVREDVLSLIGESVEGTQRVRDIVLALRDFSRPGQMEWEIVDVHRCIDSTLNVVRNEVKNKARVSLEYGDLPAVECMPSQLNQVVMNLLVNAAQAIADYGKITIRTTSDGDHVEIAVIDTGTGMPAETCAKVFDPFFTTKPIGSGTGLGLSVSYGIVERHNGSIDVRSEPGEGTTFTVRLPIRQALATEPTAPPSGK